MTDSMATPDEIANRISHAMLGVFDLVAIYLGDQLGYYRSLAIDGPATSMQLAERTATAERYAREWLEQQAVTGFLAVDDPDRPATERVFALPARYESLFVDPDSPLNVAAWAQNVLGAISPLPLLLEAYRTGSGVPYDAYGPDLAIGQARYSRPMLLGRLAQDYLPAMPDLHARLLADPPARVADLGVGMGWSSIALARAYPAITVDGFDLDPYSVEAATANAITGGVDDRVRFHVRDAGDPALAGQYDFALAVQCIHDMANPVAALAAMRRLVGTGGTVLVVDEHAEDAFAAPGNDAERLLYGFSIVHCLPIGMVEQPSAQTGALMRPDTFRRYAAEAGFSAVEILPVENDAFYFYRLTP
ncbi:MAG: class I SAM-dependent methyltransferase [Thermomicrobiales bacterium]